MTESWPAHHNWNIFASSLLVEVCVRYGSDTFFVSPGYRDAPFIAALALNPRVKVISCWDERAAGFQALGYAKAKKKPAVLICTSGTAGANYLPAVIEAKVDHVPLLVITADRPFELVFANAQQVIDQRDLFGKFVKKSLDFPSPSPTMNPRAWLSYARMMLETALDDRPGPVHLNLPFHAPLDPMEALDRPPEALIQKTLEALNAMSFQAVPKRVPYWGSELLDEFFRDIEDAERGLLLVGRLSGDAEERQAVRELRDRLGWPLFADVGSGLKFESALEIADLTIPESRRRLDAYHPDCVIHVGKRLVTRHFDDALARYEDARYWVLTDEEQVQDPYHLARRRQHRADWAHMLPRLSTLIPPIPSRALSALRSQLRKVPSPSFNFRDVAETIRLTTKGQIFLGNSTAIRAFDTWCFAEGSSLEVQANRGVSGIEGLLATTMGLALATEKLWTLVIGDISMLHDLNSIISLAQSQAQVIVVLVNNAGGRIFETLPIQKFPWVKDPLISTPHDFEFSGIAGMAGLPYALCRSKAEFEEIYQNRQRLGVSCIIECAQDAEADLKFVRALAAQEFTDE